MERRDNFEKISTGHDMREKTVLFEAQRVTKSIVYFGKTIYPIWLGIVASLQILDCAWNGWLRARQHKKRVFS
jgi:hypothetical protein